jgi:hypothetical protein
VEPLAKVFALVLVLASALQLAMTIMRAPMILVTRLAVLPASIRHMFARMATCALRRIATQFLVANSLPLPATLLIFATLLLAIPAWDVSSLPRTAVWEPLAL